MSAETRAGARLAAKLVLAAKDVGAVAKNGENKQQGYSYATASDVATACRDALLKHGVVADFHCVESEATAIQSRNGGAGLMVKATCELVVTDSDSGEQAIRQSVGYGSDYPGDKAVYKAMTGARKYAFIHLLQVPIGDDPEDDSGGRGAPTGQLAAVADPKPASNALTELCQGDMEAAGRIWETIRQANGGGAMPQVIADALVAVTAGLRAADGQDGQEPQVKPAPEAKAA